MSEQIDLDNNFDRKICNELCRIDVKFKTQLYKTNLSPIIKQCFV